MADPYLRQDALAHRGLVARSTRSAGDEGVRLWQEGARTQLALRGDAGDPAFVRAVRRVIGTALPEPSRAKCLSVFRASSGTPPGQEGSRPILSASFAIRSTRHLTISQRNFTATGSGGILLQRPRQ